MDSETARLLTDFTMMVGLLRRDIKNNKQHDDWGRYEGRFARIEQKFSSLAELISRDDPELAKALHMAFQQPSRALTPETFSPASSSRSGPAGSRQVARAQ